jgi:NarL family two-component system response regulator LiaR
VPAIRIALSNDYEVVLHGLTAMLAEHADRVEVVARTTAVKMPVDVDVILYDTFSRLPRHDEKLRDIVELNSAKVAVYTWNSYPRDDARLSGAAGYIHKGLGGAELVEAITAIHEGRAWESRDPGVDDDQSMPTWPGQEHGLSARESEVLTFIARGFSNQEIAERAYLSINTVKTYIRTAYRKVGVDSRSQAVGWALSNGFQPDPPRGRQGAELDG